MLPAHGSLPSNLGESSSRLNNREATPVLPCYDKIASLVLGVVAAVVVGWLIARSTDRPVGRGVARQVLFTLVPAVITFLIGSALGVGAT